MSLGRIYKHKSSFKDKITYANIAFSKFNGKYYEKKFRIFIKISVISYDPVLIHDLTRYR